MSNQTILANNIPFPIPFWRRHLVVDLVKMTCKGNELPLIAKDTTIIMCLLSSTPRTCMSFNPFFPHVLSPPIGTMWIPI
jgi:hypothetical protein